MIALNPPPVPDLDSQHLGAMKSHLRSEISAEASTATPFRGRRPSRVAMMLAATAALSAGAYVAETSLGHGDVADAAWSPTPSAATSAELAHAEAVCRNDDAWRAPGSRAGAAAFARTAPLVVAERRVQAYSIVLSDGRTAATCLLPDPSRSDPLASTGGFSGPDVMDHQTRPTSSGVSLLAGDALIGDGNGYTDGESRTFIYGRTGPDVRSLVIPLRRGTSVTATVTPDGWWEAWYPDGLGSGLAQLRTVRVTDADGTSHLEPLQR